jgi:hypothetical protein
MGRAKRYTNESICYQGVNGFMIFDNKHDPDHKKGYAFSTQNANEICAALNAMEARRTVRAKRLVQQPQAKIMRYRCKDIAICPFRYGARGVYCCNPRRCKSKVPA